MSKSGIRLRLALVIKVFKRSTIAWDVAFRSRLNVKDSFWMDHARRGLRYFWHILDELTVFVLGYNWFNINVEYILND